MASISSAGIGSGLDVESIVSKLMTLEQRPVQQLQSQASTIQTKISAFGQVQSALSTFRDAALKLTRSDTWGAAAATSSDATAVSVTAGSGAVAGGYAVEVQALAKPQSVATASFASANELVGEGSLQVSFSGQPDFPPLDITISSSDTLATVRNKINAAGGGITAVIVNDATGARMIISSSSPGTDNVFSISGSGGGAAFNYDENNPEAGPTTRSQEASNAEATINGVPVTSSTNTITNMMEGLTISLNRQTTGPVQLSVTSDPTSLKKDVQAFVDAYNSLSGLLASNTKYDDATKTAGKLQGDSTAVSVQRQLRNALMGESPASSVYASLANIGIDMQSNGTLKVNDSKLTSALTGNLSEVRKFFATTDVTHPENEGLGVRLRRLGDTLLGSEGALTTRTAGLSTSLSLNKKRQDEISQRLALTEARLRKQYQSLDTNMAGINGLNAYVSQQVASWNKSSS